MSGDQLNIEERLKLVQQKISAGKSALEETEVLPLCQSINELLVEIDHKIISDSKTAAESILHIFYDLHPSGLIYEIAQNVSVETAFNFGKLLLEQSGANVSNNLIGQISIEYLELIRQPEFLTRIYGEERWEDLTLQLIINSNLTLKKLFDQRRRIYDTKTLFNLIRGKNITKISWQKSFYQIDEILAAVSGVISTPGSKVAFLTDNSIKMAFCDLACLYSGIVNVMIPANSVPQHISYILNQTEAELLFVTDEKQLSKVKSIKSELIFLKNVVMFEGSSVEKWVMSFTEFLEFSKQKKVIQEIGLNDVATIMYTSGTTGEPKGIMFSNLNLVYKRFCRAIAIPEIGDRDRYLSFLPLYHTFGRYLELLGAIFWGAEYSFMENPSVETMIQNMQMIKPTIFISIPKKWIQLYESIAARVDLELDDISKIKGAIDFVTGGDLKYGLSAAGYLPSEVFTFFQKYRIELMSGFGMTEATGGITMTPPGKYTENSLGKALPGIEIRVADDGELWIKGSYVMLGYYDQTKEEVFDENGWFPTGDIMRMDSNGFIEIIDRKKEIYKNIKGETIAPQKIENFFREVEYIKQVFLVGDHRPYNTVLIYPDKNEKFDKIFSNPEQVNDYYSSVVVSVNKFLAPFERILDYKLIDRAFSAEMGELTPKGTYKRRVIEENFSSEIEQLYTKTYSELWVDDFEIRIPNWFLREKGCLNRDVLVSENGIAIPKLNLELMIHRKVKNQNLFRIGCYYYKVESKFIDLQAFFINPIYWLGNSNLVNFTGETIVQWSRHSSSDSHIKFVSVYECRENTQVEFQSLKSIAKSNERSLFGLHLAVFYLQSNNENEARFALNYVKEFLNDDTAPLYRFALHIFMRPNVSPFTAIRKQMFIDVINKIKHDDFEKFLSIYLSCDYEILDPETCTAISSLGNSEKILIAIEDTLHHEVDRYSSEKGVNQSPLPNLFYLLASFGIEHPTRYKQIRQALVRYQLLQTKKELIGLASEARLKLRNGLRDWLGQNQTVAVDEETGEEYGWEDVIIFEENTDPVDRQLITKVIIESPILREAVFLLSNGRIIRLNNILPGGVWISLWRELDEKKVYRISIQTNEFGSFDIALNLGINRAIEEIVEEVNWCILAGSRYYYQELVEDFGGLWTEYFAWTSDFVPGETVDKFINRITRRDDEKGKERVYYLWPFFIWNASASYFNFWKLTYYKFYLENPVVSNYIIPPHDYQTGTRVLSISRKKKFVNLIDLFNNFYSMFVQDGNKTYHPNDDIDYWRFIFSGLINAEGVEKGLTILNKLSDELNTAKESPEIEEIKNSLTSFLRDIEENGYIPKQLYFAINRFHRWKNLNQAADSGAEAEMLSELYDTYSLNELEKLYPETRTRFFLETVYANSDPEVSKIIKDISIKQHRKELSKEKATEKLSNLKSEIDLDEKENFFLTRLCYPHLKPSDEAVILPTRSAGTFASNLVVQYQDSEGNPFVIRSPISPREISRLHQLFLETNLMVNFKPEHQFLVALSERGFIIGGLFYNAIDSKTVYMDKIVVNNRYRRKGISDKLMNELFNRMKSENYDYVTTGFFRPEYFYHFGFKIERKYSGLVKKL
ncbi:MAG: GNAT family N-acetyltransferase [Melioribacteraceae bacterium]|nr:GNAT family N-acetyltransferase [Melioribacteraceae bacterium]